MPAEVRTFILTMSILSVICVLILSDIALIKTERRVSQVEQLENTQAAMLECYESHGAWMSGGCH